jgi:single-strand DNA-binding protein
MASFNRVILLGNVTRDIELRYLANQMAVTDIGLAVNEVSKDKAGNRVESVTFVDVTLWGRTAEVASEFLAKGSPVLIEGRLKLDTWEKDGQKRSKLKVVGEHLQLLGTKGQGGGKPAAQRSSPDNEYSQPEPAAAAPAESYEAPPNHVGDTGGDQIPF